MLSIDKKTQGESEHLILNGRLDTITAPDLDEVIQAVGEDVKELTLECKKLEYISSAGLRVLLSAQKKMIKQGGQLKLIQVNQTIMEIFEVTGFSEILTIE